MSTSCKEPDLGHNHHNPNLCPPKFWEWCGHCHTTLRHLLCMGAPVFVWVFLAAKSKTRYTTSSTFLAVIPGGLLGSGSFWAPAKFIIHSGYLNIWLWISGSVQKIDKFTALHHRKITWTYFPNCRRFKMSNCLLTMSTCTCPQSWHLKTRRDP